MSDWCTSWQVNGLLDWHLLPCPAERSLALCAPRRVPRRGAQRLPQSGARATGGPGGVTPHKWSLDTPGPLRSYQESPNSRSQVGSGYCGYCRAPAATHTHTHTPSRLGPLVTRNHPTAVARSVVGTVGTSKSKLGLFWFNPGLLPARPPCLRMASLLLQPWRGISVRVDGLGSPQRARRTRARGVRKREREAASLALCAVAGVRSHWGLTG